MPHMDFKNGLKIVCRIIVVLLLCCIYLQNSTTQRNETLLAIGTAYVQGEDVAARGRVLLYSVERNSDNIQAKVACYSILVFFNL